VSADGTVARGAYGARFVGFSDAELLPPLPQGAGWQTVELSEQPLTTRQRPRAVEGTRVVVPLTRGSCAVVEREPSRGTLVTAAGLSARQFDHAFLAVVGACFARWRGDESFHAGAFVVDGAAWAVVGHRRAGKSSLLAALAAEGYTVLTDDLLVVSAGRALAGARCIDLRPAAAARLDPGGDATVGGRDGRRRLRLAPAGLEVPLRGWIFLSWGDRVDLRYVAPRERLGRLSANRNLGGTGLDSAPLLALAGLPGWELSRPRSWPAMAEVVDRLIDCCTR
jgi:hypothetical protein